MRDSDSGPRIDAAHVEIGRDVTFGARVQIGGIRGPAESVVIGDNVHIGDDVRILAPRAIIGDWSVIHHHTTIAGYAPVEIGACCWIGQNVLLNCTDALTLERGAIMSAYSQVYTHSSGGDVVQGWRFAVAKPARIGADAYIGPGCIVAPVQIGARAMVLAGGVVTKDLPPNTTWAGTPAVDVTSKLGAPFAEPLIEVKFEHMAGRLRSFAAAQGVEVPASGHGWSSAAGIAVTTVDLPEDGATSVFDLRDRTYSKLRTSAELAFMRMLLPHVKFYPRSE